jgi:hypothetical protein
VQLDIARDLADVPGGHHSTFSGGGFKAITGGLHVELVVTP